MRRLLLILTCTLMPTLALADAADDAAYNTEIQGMCKQFGDIAVMTMDLRQTGQALSLTLGAGSANADVRAMTISAYDMQKHPMTIYGRNSRRVFETTWNLPALKGTRSAEDHFIIYEAF